MKYLDLKQGSKEWLDARLNFFCASEAPAMMGASNYKTRNQLLKEKKGFKEEITPEKQALFDRGHKAEDLARELLEAELLKLLPPKVAVDTISGMDLLASFDGIPADENFLFEHKLISKALRENIANNVIEPTHYWQLEHQLLVSGAKYVLFVASDGTYHDRCSLHYESVPERREQLIAGWMQFKEDLAEFTLEATPEVLEPVKTDSLPVITYSVTGTTITSNIAECLPLFKSRSKIEMERELESDQDFANKEALNKKVKLAREKLQTTLSNVEGEFVSFSEFATAAKEIDSILQKMQSHGEKQVKQQKEKRKQDAINEANKKLDAFIIEKETAISPLRFNDICFINSGFVEACKNKRTLDSIKNSIDTALANAKIEVSANIDKIAKNVTYLNENAEEYKFLFADITSLVLMDIEAFTAIVNQRVNAHKEEINAKEAEEKQAAEIAAKSATTEESATESPRLSTPHASTETITPEATPEGSTLTEEIAGLWDMYHRAKNVHKEQPGILKRHKAAIEGVINRLNSI